MTQSRSERNDSFTFTSSCTKKKEVDDGWIDIYPSLDRKIFLSPSVHNSSRISAPTDVEIFDNIFSLRELQRTAQDAGNLDPVRG